MARAPYILARTLKEAHEFAREKLGLSRGQYRVVMTPSTVSSVRGSDLHLVPGHEKRYDRFAMRTALKYTRLNLIEHDVDEAPVTAPEQPDGLKPPGVQLTIVSSDDATAFFGVTVPEETPVTEQAPTADETPEEPQAEVPAEPKKNRRRSRCKECGTLHFKEDACPSEPLPGV